MCEYHCTDCEENETCATSMRWKRCKTFRKWLSEQWRRIRILFRVECVDSTLEEKGCDSE